MRYVAQKKMLSLVVVCVLIFSTLFQYATPIFAGENAKVVEADILDFKLESPKGTPATKINKNDSFFLSMDWKVRDNNAILHKGDYFDIKLPDNLNFPPGLTQPDFDILDENGDVIAKAHVTPGSGNNGGKIRVTFTDKVNNKYNVKGKMYIAALFNKDKIKNNQKNTFDVSVNGKVKSTDVDVVTVGPPADQLLTKWGERVVENGQPVNKVRWYAKINYRKSDLKNVVFSDSLVGNETYIKDSFRLTEVEYNEEGNPKKIIGNVNLDGKLTFSNGDKSFKINLGSPGKKQYQLAYSTTYTPGTSLTNKLKVSYDGDTKEVSVTYVDNTAGGSAGGDLASKIKLIKVDEEDNNIVLADAIFEVTGPDGKKFELKTGADGTVISERLVQGSYKVKEKKAPKGYELGGEEYVLTVTATGGAIKKITNKKIKIDVSGEKTWDDANNQDGKRPSKITVNLLSNGTKIQSQEVKADQSGKWTYNFKNLPKFDNQGNEIKYTVTEEAVDGYNAEVNGTNIKNIHKPEVTSVPVTKKWIGKPASSAKINLYADGVKKDSITLNEANHWQHTFTNLDKYKDGKEIKYTVKEEAIANYDTAVSGDMASGFTVTNTNIEKVNIPVTKTWIGKAADSVTVKLLADGVVKETATLNAAGNWKHTFANLPKYDANDGHEIVYTVKEDAIPGYKTTISGDVQSGFVITNTKDIPKIPPKPNTGDNSNLIAYGFVLLISATCTLILVRIRSRRKI